MGAEFRLNAWKCARGGDVYPERLALSLETLIDPSRSRSRLTRSIKELFSLIVILCVVLFVTLFAVVLARRKPRLLIWCDCYVGQLETQKPFVMTTDR
jgi:hypothetical protein